MNHSELIDKLLHELSYRVGIPNIYNKEHQSIMSEILTEWGEIEAKNTILSFLTEKGKTPDMNKKADTEGDDKDYVHIGRGIYVRKSDVDSQGKAKKDSQKYNKDDNGSMRALSAAEYQSIKSAQGEEGEKAAANSTQNQQGSQDKGDTQEPEQGTAMKTQDVQDRVAKEDEVRAKIQAEKDGTSTSNNKTDKTLGKQQQKDLDDMKSKSENWEDQLEDDKKKLLDKAFYHIEIVMSEDATDEEKKQSAEWLQENVGFATNANKSKAYLNKLGGLRKILSNMAGGGSAATKRLVSEMEKHVTLKEFSASGVKKRLTSAAKPDLGKENEFSPKKNPKVDEFFRKHPQLSKIREGLWGVFGVKGEDGKIKMPSNKYAKEYLEQSFNNPALTRTIETAKEFAKNGDLDPKFVSALEQHQERLAKITENYKIPSEEAEKAINDSYNRMMAELHEADSDAASAVLKQLAENRLYEVELARGEEVYLPSNGSFPGGDKIKVDTLERVSLVSCKWGKSGRTYGCPANAKAVTSLHPNPKKRNNQGQYVGEDGYTLLVNDDLIKGNTTQETQDKTVKFMKDTLREVGLDGVFTEEEYQEIAKITTEYLEFIESIKRELEGTKPAELYWQLFNEKIQKFEDEISERLGNLIGEDKIAQLIGENNKSALGPKGTIRPQNLLSAIEIANNIRTSDGYGLEHNKQYFEKGGNPKFQTDMGTANPNDYSITFRDKRTPGRTGGGCQLSFTGDGGDVIDTYLGEDGIQSDQAGTSKFD